TPAPAITYSQNSGTTFSVGTTVVTATASNVCGMASCTFSVTVNDVQKPSITCSTNIVLSADSGQCSRSNVTYITTVSDNCSGATVSCTPTNGATFPIGTNTVSCVATDAAGNTNSCTFTVAIRDTEAPAITCPANIVTNTVAGQCSQVVSFV